MHELFASEEKANFKEYLLDAAWLVCIQKAFWLFFSIILKTILFFSFTHIAI